MGQQSIYVNVTTGDDRQDGSATHPLKTLTTALARSTPGTTLHVAPGQYTAASGERFPLMLGTRLRLVGSGQGRTVIQGGGGFTHSAVGAASLTCRMAETAQLEAVTLTNPAPGGMGLWLDAGRAIIQSVTLQGCDRYGAVIAATALPTVLDSELVGNGTAGLALFQQGKGALVRLRCHQNATGIALHDQAGPLIQTCELTQNDTGIAIADQARPVLRGNRIRQNRGAGVLIRAQAQPDLGTPWDLGANIMRDNGGSDIHNQGSALEICGNDVVPQGLQGPIALVASALPDAAAVPAPLSGSTGDPTPATPPTPPPSPAPTPVGSQRFWDLGNHWAAPFVDGLADQELIKGFLDGSFRPDAPVTRAQFAALVVASFPDQPQHRPPVAFRDVAATYWGAAVLDQAQRQGFLSGYPDGTMRPEQSITRIQAIVAIANGLALPAAGVDAIGIYRDRAQVPSYAVDGLAAATQQRLVVNAPEALVLRPMEPITRGEVAALVYQGRVYQGNATAIASPYIVEPDASQPLFSDIHNHWAADFIRGLATAQLVSGMKDGRFLPDAPMNRAQYAALVVQAFQPQPRRAAAAFRDVPSDFWAADAIQQAYRGHFMSGFPDQTFGPQHPLLRVQVWVSLVDGLGLGTTATVDLNVLGQFTDYTQIPRYALKGLAIATTEGLVVNFPEVNTLRPNQIATRGEVCALVYQALVASDRLPPQPSPYIAPPQRGGG
jgi:parallel beta-helix repeat protein